MGLAGLDVSAEVEVRITADAAYLKHERNPLVRVWGIGFDDGCGSTLGECRELVEFFKADGCAVMLGVPTGWLEGNRDAFTQPELREIIALADVVGPWTIGRYQTPAQIRRHVEKRWKPDLAWCAGREIDCLPVVFPGFSWNNLKGGREKLGAIPKLKGQSLWSQLVAAKRVGCGMSYVAMSDEVDEGAAIFKCTNDPASEQLPVR